MSEAAEVKARRSALQERRQALEERLEKAGLGERRGLRLELAAVKEDIADCNARLRELMPRHRVSFRKTWAGTDDRSWDLMQYRTWAEMEGAEEPEGPTDRDYQTAAIKDAGYILTEKQTRYFRAWQGKRGSVTAEGLLYGVNRSTVSRMAKRAREKLEREARALFEAKRLVASPTPGGAARLDLSDPEHLRMFLDRLTDRQQLYLFLYYGEWMTLREIGQMLSVDHVSVLRGIRRGLERLDAVLGEGAAYIGGIGALEDLLMESFNGLQSEAWMTAAPRETKGPPKGIYNPRPDPPFGFRTWADRAGRVLCHQIGDGPVYRRYLLDGGTGRLRAWLEERRSTAEEAEQDHTRAGYALRRLLTVLFRRIRAVFGS